MPTLQFKINGRAAQAPAEPQTCWSTCCAARLRLTGTHVGCDTGQCGACTVLLDGQAVKSCTHAGGAGAGRSVSTVEGLAARRQAAPGAGSLHRLPRPAVRLLHAGHDDGGRCLLAENPQPERSGDRARAGRQPVPLHRLREHRRRGQQAAAAMAAEPRNERAARAARRGALRQRPARCAASKTRRWCAARAVHRRRGARRPDLHWCSCARRMRTRASSRSTAAAALGDARRAARCSPAPNWWRPA